MIEESKMQQKILQDRNNDLLEKIQGQITALIEPEADAIRVFDLLKRVAEKEERVFVTTFQEIQQTAIVTDLQDSPNKVTVDERKPNGERHGRDCWVLRGCSGCTRRAFIVFKRYYDNNLVEAVNIEENGTVKFYSKDPNTNKVTLTKSFEPGQY